MFDSSLAAESRYFEVYIQPLLKNPNERPRNVRYFFQQGWLGWRHSVQKKDINDTQFVISLCEQLYKEDEQEFLQVVSSILDSTEDTGLRTEQAEDALFNALKGSELETIFSTQLNLYKTLFESDFRLYGTIPYFYLCKKYGKAHKVKDSERFVDVSASEKFHTIKNTALPMPNGSFPDLVSGFDNHVRNAGAGHDRWETTDSQTVILKVVDDKSGGEKKRYEFTQKELRDILQQCRINLWVLRNGLFIFLENNPEIDKKIASKRVYKIRDIKEATKAFAVNRSFILSDFNLDNERTRLELSIKYNPPIIGTNEQIFFGRAEAYDIVHLEEKVPYEYQMLDIVKQALLHLDKERLPIVFVNMKDENDEDLGTVEYEVGELQKLLEEEGEVQMPVPKSGTIPKIDCKIDVPIRVPYGKGAEYEKRLKEEQDKGTFDKR
ncbi:MAG: hypothetical protein WDZ75_01355 [Candidatus Paceibacterota bacterium]